MALRDNLVSWWSMDESSTGSSAVQRNDSHGSNHLTDNNTTASATGKKSNAADFERANTEYLSIAHASQSGLGLSGDFSFSFWIKMEADNNGQHSIIAKDSGTDSQRCYYLLYNDNGTPMFQMAVFPTGYSYPNYWAGNFTYTLTPGTWYHIVVYVDIDAAYTAKAYLYVNGTGQGFFTRADGNNATSIQAGTAPFQIGYVSFTGAMDGLLDEVGIWSRILTSAEVTELYNSGNGLDYAGTSSAVNVTVTPSALVLTSSLPAPTVSAVRNVSVSADVLALTTSLPTPSVSISAQVSPDVLTLTTSLPTPTVSAGGNVTVTPATLTLTSAVQEPTVSVEVSVTVTPAVLAITTSTPEPSVSLGTGVSVAVSPLSLSASLPTPTVTAEKDVTVTVSPLTLSISLLEPSKIGATWQRIGRHGSSDDWSRVARTDVA